MEGKVLNKNIYASLVAFQGEVPVILKNNDIVDKSGKPKYKYASLSDIKVIIAPIMLKNSLGVVQTVCHDNDTLVVTTKIIHTSGEFIESSISASVKLNTGYMSNIQAIGSVSTYLRRYGMSTMLGLVTDVDVDGTVVSVFSR